MGKQSVSAMGAEKNQLVEHSYPTSISREPYQLLICEQSPRCPMSLLIILLSTKEIYFAVDHNLWLRKLKSAGQRMFVTGAQLKVYFWPQPKYFWYPALKER